MCAVPGDVVKIPLFGSLLKDLPGIRSRNKVQGSLFRENKHYTCHVRVSQWEGEEPGIQESLPGKNGNFVSASQGRQS